MGKFLGRVWGLGLCMFHTHFLHYKETKTKQKAKKKNPEQNKYHKS